MGRADGRHRPRLTPPDRNCSGSIVCVGGAAIDRTYRALAPLRPHTSNPAAGAIGQGGVARNVAECLSRLGVATSLVSAIGDDAPGRALRAELEAAGVETGALVTRAQGRTAEYVAVLEPDGELALGIADMAILDTISPDDVEQAGARLDAAAWVFADCNLPASVLDALVERRDRSGYRLAVDAVSTPKAARLRPLLAGIDLLFLNTGEAAVLLGARPAGRVPPALAASLRARGAGAVVLTCGADGLVLATSDGTAPVGLAGPAARVVDVTGAGDALIAGTLSRLPRGADLVADLRAACRIGLLAACLAIESAGSVRADLSPALIARHLHRLPARPTGE